MIVISPGLAKDQPPIAAAVARGVELVGDIELFARALRPAQRVLAITGSNGKTTVAALTGELARAAGLSAAVVGNIGEPVLDVLAGHERGAPWPDVFVIELSSFQLETTASLKTIAATVLNVTANHLDRYAGIDDYAKAKARIFAGGGEQILNRDDPRSLAMRVPGRIVQTFGAGIPEAELDWGLVARNGSPWLARGGALLVADGRAGADRPAQRAQCARGAGVDLVGRQDRWQADRRAGGVPRASASHGTGRRNRRRPFRQRFQGNDRRRDAGGARRP